MLAGLNEAGVRYVIVGGIAANAHGSSRNTQDVDICYEPTPENRECLAAVLCSWHGCLRGVEPGLPWTLDARAIRDTPILTLTTNLGAFDMMDRVAGVGDFRLVIEASQEVTVMGVSTRVITLDALIAAKRATGRRKDREALLELEALREMARKRKKAVGESSPDQRGP
jgi:predicted nucleotidyltransferase